MAVYCPDSRLLFIGNMRTGSTAIGRGLVEHCGGAYVPAKVLHIDGERIRKRHATLSQLVSYELLDRPAEELLVFTAVRNPFDSLVSQWTKLRHRPNRSHTRAARLEWSFDRWIRHWHSGCKDGFSLHGPYVEGTDVVIRFEDLDAGLAKVLDLAGAPRFNLPKVNTTSHRDHDYRAYYTDETRGLVEEVLAEDIRTHGYTF